MFRPCIRASAAAILMVALSAPAHAATPEEKCSAEKLKAFSKRVSSDLRCQSRGLLRGEPVDPACLNKSEQNFLTALERAEEDVDCAGDTTTISQSVETCVGGAVDPIAPIIVPVHVHVIHNGSAGNVSDTAIANQMNVLNESFNGGTGGAITSFQFELAGIDRTLNSTWFNMDPGTTAERQAKEALRQGDASHLNVYLINTNENLGWATFPSSYASRPWDDGVVVMYSSLPGGSAAPYNFGDTLVQKTGTWMGLYYIWQGGCGGSGDLVDDTPTQDTPAFGCPQRRDTCLVDNFYDDVGNFMNFTDDACMDHFTKGQAARMLSQWQQYRGNGEAPVS